MPLRSARYYGRIALSYAVDMLALNTLARNRNRQEVLVLLYHGVISDRYAEHPLRSPNMVTITEFREQMLELKRLWNPVSAREFRSWLRGETVLPPFPALVTFDDGYANNLSHAAPVLTGYGIPAVFFITTGHVGSRRPLWPTEVFLRVCFWPGSRIPLPLGGDTEVAQHSSRVRLAWQIEQTCKELPSAQCARYLNQLRAGQDEDRLWSGNDYSEMFSFLSWDGVRRLRQLGFEIGSHTVAHPILSRASKTQLAHEVQASKKTIEDETGRECFCFAYPNGSRRDFTAETVEFVRQAGYDFAFTATEGLCHRAQETMLLNRVWIPGRADLRGFRTRASGVHAALKALTRAA